MHLCNYIVLREKQLYDIIKFLTNIIFRKTLLFLCTTLLLYYFTQIKQYY